MKWKAIGLLGVGLLAGSMAASAAVIDTTGSANSTICCFGEPDTATYGQTFTVGSETRLDSFTFYQDDLLDSDFVDFAAYVMAWDGAKATGSVLFSSSGLSTTNNGGAGGMEAFVINTGGLVLSSAQQYVAFFSASNFFDGTFGTSRWLSVAGSSVYAGGQFVYNNNGSNFGLLTTTVWNQNFQCAGCDLAFRMDFSAVPEPGTLALLGLGLLGLGAARRKAA